MLSETVTKTTREVAALPIFREVRKQSGFARLLGISGILMSLALPIGIVPRIMQGQELSASHKKIVQQLPQVSITKVKPAPETTKLSLPGSVEAIEETELFGRTNGYVKQRFVDIGDRVKAGQLLAKLETPEVDQSEKEAQAQVLTTVAGKAQSEASRDRAQADLDSAIAQVSQAQASLVEAESDQKFSLSTFKRWKQLGDDGAVSQQDVDEKDNRYKTTSAARQAAFDRVRAAKSEVVAARAKLKAEAANVDVNTANILASRARADRTLTEKSFQNVVSPFAGVITERGIDTGMLVTSGSENSKTAMYKIARLDTVKVFIDVPQYASSGVKTGQQVKVNLKEFPGRVFSGTVARTAVALDATARTLRTEIHIDNKDLALAPGMYADVNITVPNIARAFLIPANALVSSSAGQRVSILSADKTVHFKNVELGHDLGTDIEVMGGLSGNESVVVNPPDTLQDGARVTVSQ